MKLVKSLLLSAPAAILAFSGANAADLPSKKAAPVSYVKICDAYGAGFFYIPGTDTCLKVGGYVRAQYEMTSHKASAVVTPGAGQVTQPGGTVITASAAAKFTVTGANQQDDLGWMARGRIDLDARTQSSFGTVRTVLGLRLQNTSGEFVAAAPAGNASVSPTVEAAFIQFAGITAGRATENFQFMPASTHFWTGQHEWANFSSGIKQLAYTVTFGGGFSATIALEDKADYVPGLSAVGVLYADKTTPNSISVPNDSPVVVANLRADQAWGSAQLMGAIDQNQATTVGNKAGLNLAGLAKAGYAIGGGLKINLPMLAAGDQLWLTAAYADGLIDLLSQGQTSQNTSDSYQQLRGLQRADYDVTFNPDGSSAGTTKGYSVGGAFQHYWIPTVRSVLGVSYAEITPPSVVRNTPYLLGGLSKAKVLEVSGSMIWSPVQNFDIGLELAYRKLNQSVDAASAATLAATYANVKTSPDAFNARLRLQRQF